MHMHIHLMMYMQAQMQMLHATATATAAIAATAVTLLSHCCHTAADSQCHTDTGGHSNGHVTATRDTDFDRWGQARAIHPISKWRG